MFPIATSFKSKYSLRLSGEKPTMMIEGGRYLAPNLCFILQSCGFKWNSLNSWSLFVHLRDGRRQLGLKKSQMVRPTATFNVFSQCKSILHQQKNHFLNLPTVISMIGWLSLWHRHKINLALFVQPDEKKTVKMSIWQLWDKIETKCLMF